ncbi:MAG: NlpC/P60 family protein [Coriobacteriia bacterium]|nr:NlpC/P60 family protein [Coriobacteriia bacterium]
MPKTCETLNECSQTNVSKHCDVPLSRRGFVSLAAVAAAGVCATQLLSAPNAFAVTSAEKQAEADEVRRKMSEWNALLDQYSNDYNNALDAHDTAVAGMDEAQGRIDVAQARQSELQDMLGKRASSMYRQGPLGFLDVIFGAHSFEEFSTSWRILSDVNERDANLIDESRAVKKEAELARKEFASQEKAAAKALNAAEAAKAEAQNIVNTYQSELSGLEDEVAKLVEKERKAEAKRKADEARRAEEAAQAASNQSSGSSGASAGGYVPYDGETYGSIVEAALSRVGCDYVWAATGPNSFDCSGLTMWSYNQVGLSIPRGGNAQYSDAPMRLNVSDAQPGDILWMYNHVGIYIGKGKFVHAPSPGLTVCVQAVSGYGWQGAARWS